MAEVLEPRKGSAMETMADKGVVFTRMTRTELDERRQDTQVIDRSGEGQVRLDEPLPPPEVGPPPPPLSARETYEVLLGAMWANMRKDRDAHQRSIKWLRATVPDAVSFLSDEQLFDHLEMLARKHTERVLRSKGLIKPVWVSSR